MQANTKRHNWFIFIRCTQNLIFALIVLKINKIPKSKDNTISKSPLFYWYRKLIMLDWIAYMNKYLFNDEVIYLLINQYLTLNQRIAHGLMRKGNLNYN